MNSKVVRAVLGCLMVVLVVTPFAEAGKKRLASLDVTLTQTKTSKPTAVKFAIKFTNRGSKDNPNFVEIKLPKGTTIDNGATTQCDFTVTSNPDACPPGSEIGSGNVILGEVPYDMRIFNDEARFWLVVDFGGFDYPIPASIDGRKISASLFSSSKVNLKLDKVSGASGTLIKTPASCPRSKRWTSNVKVTYTRDSGSDDDVSEKYRARSACRR